MSRLIPIEYRNRKYPSHIKPQVQEIAGNFDVKFNKKVFNIECMDFPALFSLHTEYSYGKREFNSIFFQNLESITSAQKKGIPQLWYNAQWADNFYEFVIRLLIEYYPDGRGTAGAITQDLATPLVLEIHPPFNDYCKSFDQFLDVYKVFYMKFKEYCPGTTVLIENRFGTMYKGGEFLLSKCSDVLEFANILKSNPDIGLKIVLDYPQLFSAESQKDANGENWMAANPSQLVEKIITFNQELVKYREAIGGFHMWGKCKDKNGKWAPHAGNFDTFFSNNNELKHKFLHSVYVTFNDGIDRYFVPEVNSGENDLHSIVADMEKEGFVFTSEKIMGWEHYTYCKNLHEGDRCVAILREEDKIVAKFYTHKNWCTGHFCVLDVRNGFIVNTIDVPTFLTLLQNNSALPEWEFCMTAEHFLHKAGIYDISPSDFLRK